MQIMPWPSMTSAPGAGTLAATATMAPLRTCTSPLGNSPSAGSIVSTWAPRTTNSPRAGSPAAGAPAWANARCGSRLAAPSKVDPASTLRRSM